MDRVVLAEICNAIMYQHIDKLKSELPEIIKNNTDSSKSIEENTANLVANVAANSIRHSVQIVTDVLASLELIELDH